MCRRALFVLTGSLILLGGIGCARSLELETISHFSDALEKGDVEALKQESSISFREKALRSEEAGDDLKLLRLPKGEITILEERDVSDTEKLVTVSVGKPDRKVRYRLVRETGDDKKWMVDEVTVRQTREGLKVAKAVSEQMNLLLSVREFLNAWNEGSRDEVLAVATPQFRQVLAELPPGYLARLTGQAVDDRKANSKLKPDVQMDEDVAVVTLPGEDGDLIVSYRMQGDGWKVSDLAVESRTTGKHIPSVAKMANVVHSADKFLVAYSAADKRGLEAATTGQFYRASLAPADLSMVQLPGSLQSMGDYEVTLNKNQADLVVRGESEFTRFSLTRTQSEEASDTVPRFLVDDVTIFEIDGSQEKRLSALFTAHATMLVFSDALRRRNLPLIRKTASREFNQRVWDQIDDASANSLPLDEIEDDTPQVLTTSFDGAVTEITVMQGRRALTYVLRDENREMRVHDVHIPVLNRPTSLKTNLELIIPIRDFVAGISSQNVDRLKRTSSDDFNRLVWRQTDTIPQAGKTVPRHLQGKLSTVRIGDDEALVVLGNEQQGARIKLKREYGRYVVDDVVMIDGPGDTERAELKRTLRIELAEKGTITGGQTVAKPATSFGREIEPHAENAETDVPPPVVAPVEETFGSVRPRQTSLRITPPSAN